MITRIVINHVKEGHKEDYIAVSKAFLAELMETCGCMEATVYEVEGSNDVANIETWPDVETADAVTKTDTFRKFVPQLVAHFAGNETLVLHKK